MAGQSVTISYQKVVNVIRSDVQISVADDNIKNISSIKNLKAVWDTGATNSVITEDIAQQLGLFSSSKTKVMTPNGERICSQYYISVLLPSGIFVPKLLVTEGTLVDFDMLIGMDIIGRGDFAITNNDGKTVMSFRCPSLMKIDFVEKTYLEPVHSNKISRNSLCPCGSGKKYKLCCGKNAL